MATYLLHWSYLLTAMLLMAKLEVFHLFLIDLNFVSSLKFQYFTLPLLVRCFDIFTMFLLVFISIHSAYSFIFARLNHFISISTDLRQVFILILSAIRSLTSIFSLFILAWHRNQKHQHSCLSFH